MSTTTQILFNSPALHSLKREQLVKLCKIHSIKANGKNVELIQRLRQHAQCLPKDSPLSIAARSEPSGPIPLQAPNTEEQEEEEEMDDPASHRSRMARPSEQWEVVMDSIEEVEEGSSQGTLSSQRTVNNPIPGEFGTGSSRSTTVSSSIKALATSLGLKRGPSKITPPSTASSKASAAVPPPSIPEANDELTQKATPSSALPETTSMPQMDHSTLDSNRMSLDNNEVPLPGHVLRPGVPAPVNARLSLGLGLGVPSTPRRQAQPTTTIRLVSNPLSNPGQNTSYAAGDNGTPQLKPFQTNFDISFGSPAPSDMGFGFGSLSSWPPRKDDDVQMNGIYPKLTVNDLPPTVEYTPRKAIAVDADDDDVAMPGSLSTNQEPFIFGSPNPRHSVSDDQFRAAAASVLEEMNQRLREDGVDEIELDIIAKLHPSKKNTAPPRDIKPIPASKRGEISSKFERLHEQEFNKMEGIDELLKRRAERSPPKKAAEDDEERPVVGKKRKSSVIEKPGQRRPSVVAGRASTTRVISSGRRAKALPGAFLDDDDDEEEQEEEDRGGKRVRIDPEAGPSSLEEIKSQEAANDRRREELEKEKEAIRKKLEANKARRRSSAAHGGGLAGRKSGRVSVGRPRPSVLLKSKPKSSRFGFFSSAKTLVQSVWNRGKEPTNAAPSNIPKPSHIIKLDTPKGKEKEKMGPPSLLPARKAAPAPARPTTAVASGSAVPAMRVNKQKPDEKGLSATTTTTTTTRGSIASSSRSRSPIPSFNTSSSRNSLQSNAAAASFVSGGGGGTRTSRTSSMASPPNSRAGSVIGTTRTTRSRTSSSTNVSSMGNRLSTATRVSAQGTMGSMRSKKVLGSGSSSVASRLSTTSSRLLAPTASSLAKNSRSSAAAGLKSVSEDRYSQKALGSITNSPTVAAAASSSGPAFSPKSGGIFSRPLLLPPQQSSAGIPTPVKKRTVSGDTTASSMAQAAYDGISSPLLPPQQQSSSGIPAPVKKRTVSGDTTASNLAQAAYDGISSPLLPPQQPSSGIPAPVKKRTVSGDTTASSLARAAYDGISSPLTKGAASGSGTMMTRARSLNGRKPRISRSKVIARLASQRAAGTSSSSGRTSSGNTSGSSGARLAPRASNGSGSATGKGKVRSSLGAKVSRASYGGGGVRRTSGGPSGGLLMSAKKRARQSEYARRRSRVGGDESGGGKEGTSMEVDA